jgi:peptide/nickel transport system substrate-binding protein
MKNSDGFEQPSRRTVLKAAGAMGLSALIWPKAGFAQSQTGGTLKVRSYGDLQVLDPCFRVSEPDADIARCIFAGLVLRDTGDKWGWKPMAAKTIEELDHTHIHFVLRDDVGFTNGFGQMTAEDVKYSIERIANPANKSPYIDDWALLDHVEVKDTLSGIIVLKKPFAPLWNSTMPGTSGMIMSKRAMEQVGGHFETKPPAESGPYLLTEWQPKQRTVLTRNPDWKGEAPAYDRIEIMPVDDASAAERAFEAGDLDFTLVPTGSVSRLQKTPPANAEFVTRPPLSYVWIGLNQEATPFTNPKTRRAMQHAIDRKTVVDAYSLGGAGVAQGIIAPSLLGHRDKVLYDYDPDKATALLKEVGGINEPLTLDILSSSENLAAAQVIQANLAAVGVNMAIKEYDTGAYWTLGAQSAGDAWKTLQMYIGRFSMEPDPSWATAWFVPEQIGIWNWERWNSKEFGDLHKAGLVEFDQAKRDAIYKHMQDLMDESGSYIFLTHEVKGCLFRKTVAPGLTPDGSVVYPAFKQA